LDTGVDKRYVKPEYIKTLKAAYWVKYLYCAAFNNQQITSDEDINKFVINDWTAKEHTARVN
jgi:hypothetical protein